MVIHIWHTFIIIMAWALLYVAFFGWGLLLTRFFKIYFPGRDKMLYPVWMGWFVALLLFNIINLAIPLNFIPSLVIYGFGLILAVGFIYKKKPTVNFRRPPEDYILGIIFIMVVLYLAWRAMLIPIAYDSGLYHFNAIRWLNECAIIPGLGNLHGRLAFNQSFFTYVASLNLFPLFGKGHNFANSFLLFLMLGHMFSSFKAFINYIKKECSGISFHNMAVLLISPAVFFMIVHDEVSSPNPDIASTILQFVLFISFLKAVEAHMKKQPGTTCTVFILVTAATALTLKLSNAFFALAVTLLALALLYKEISINKEVRRIIFQALLFSIIVIAIWSVRGIITSGYPAYPSTIGRFDTEWTIPRESVRNEAEWVFSWARQPGVPKDEVIGNWNWLKPWITRILFDPTGFLYILYPSTIWILLTIVAGYFCIKAKGESLFEKIWLPILVSTPVTISIIAWFFIAPDIRFGQAYFFLLPVIASLALISFFGVKNNQPSIAFLICLLFIIANFQLGYWLLNNAFKRDNISLTGIQQIRVVELISRETDTGLLIWLPSAGDQTWDAPIPATPYFNPGLLLRVENDLCKGFKLAR